MLCYCQKVDSNELSEGPLDNVYKNWKKKSYNIIGLL
jgi:hypothetical protein